MGLITYFAPFMRLYNVKDKIRDYFFDRLSMCEEGEVQKIICARNEVVSTLRSKWESQVDKVQVLPEGVSDDIQPDVMMNLLHPVLAKMPRKRAEVFRMSKLNGLSDEEIAARMGISVRTVEKHLELARREVSVYLS